MAFTATNLILYDNWEKIYPQITLITQIEEKESRTGDQRSQGGGINQGEGEYEISPYGEGGGRTQG